MAKKTKKNKNKDFSPKKNEQDVNPDVETTDVEDKKIKEAKVIDQNLLIVSSSVKDGIIIYELSGKVHVRMNDEKNDLTSKRVGSQLKVKL